VIWCMPDAARHFAETVVPRQATSATSRPHVDDRSVAQSADSACSHRPHLVLEGRDACWVAGMDCEARLLADEVARQIEATDDRRFLFDPSPLYPL